MKRRKSKVSDAGSSIQPPEDPTVDEAASEINLLFDEAVDLLWSAVDERMRSSPRGFVEDLHWRCRLEDELGWRLDVIADHLDVLIAAATRNAHPTPTGDASSSF